MAELDSRNMTPPKLITSLSSPLQRVSVSNDLNPEFKPKNTSSFHCLARPNITIHSYLQRIFKYANCSPSFYVVAYVYLDRFTQRQPELQINSYNVHRLLITSVMVSSKFMDDRYYNNAYHAKVGGISTTEMNFLELDFLFGLGFHLYVSPTNFQTYCSHLHRHMILHSPNLNFAEDHPSLSTAKIHLCFSADRQDESALQKQQLAV
ncbi:cyclin-U4-1-like [Primulina tabacum]|uniref:cyclin-U4-1-like n=1 Tax=Primulina tabacum TaxID=48773 RepID=UPI003F5ACC39